jgi:HK97 family phage prohead protease
MPYFIEQVSTGWNTVKDDGEVLGQHKSKAEAIAQMLAVSLAEGIAPGGERAVDPNETYSPPAGVAVAAKRALKWISEGLAGDGFTDVGRARAVQLASGADISGRTVNRMISFLARQEQSVKGATGFNAGEEGYPSPGRVSWDSWGGDPAKAWVNSLPQSNRDVAVDAGKIDVRQMEGYILSELQEKAYSLKGDALETIAKLAETVYELCEIVDSMGEPVVVEDVVPMEDMPEVLDLSSKYMEEDSVRFVAPSKVAELHERGERVVAGIEQRVAVQDLEIRQEGDGMTLRGYAAVFNSPSQPLPFIETIQPGAFRDSLKSRNDVKLLWNHDTSIVLGSTRAGTLRLTEDERGLLVEASLPMTQAGKDAAISISRGDVTAFSFGFRIPAGGDEWASASERVLKRVNVHEVSVGVAFPAYTATDGTANVRSVTELSEKIMKLAEIRGVSAEELTDALLALESGEELTERQGELLTDTLGKVLKKDPEVTNPQALLDLKKKQLDLLMQRV